MKTILRLMTILLVVLVPFLLVLTAARVIWNPFFLKYEYNLPNFPPDEFGFTTTDRLKWGTASMNYILNNEPDDYLSTLKFQDGSPIYNERELSHMLDVRLVVKAALWVWYGIIGFTLLTALVSLFATQQKKFWKAISSGGWLTIGLTLAIIMAILIDFNAFFAAFHSLFFKENTWIFYTSDTLIRLYPEKLWSDGFTFAGILTIVFAVVCAFLGRKLSK